MLDTLFWLLALLAASFVGVPASMFLFRRLPSAGSFLVKPLGVLTVGYLAWLFLFTGLFANGRVYQTAVLFVAVGVAAAILLLRPRACPNRSGAVAPDRNRRSDLRGGIRCVRHLPRAKSRYRRDREADGVRVAERHSAKRVVSSRGPVAFGIQHQLLLLRLQHRSDIHGHNRDSSGHRIQSRARDDIRARVPRNALARIRRHRTCQRSGVQGQVGIRRADRDSRNRRREPSMRSTSSSAKETAIRTSGTASAGTPAARSRWKTPTGWWTTPSPNFRPSPSCSATCIRT